MKLTLEMRIAIVDHAVRWANNMLVEVLSNHGAFLSEKQRELLTQAVSALSSWVSA